MLSALSGAGVPEAAAHSIHRGDSGGASTRDPINHRSRLVRALPVRGLLDPSVAGEPGQWRRGRSVGPRALALACGLDKAQGLRMPKTEGVLREHLRLK